MKPRSAKAKGRRFQQEVRDALLSNFPFLEPDDIRSTSMGASGEDILLSPAARRVYPYSIAIPLDHFIELTDFMNFYKTMQELSEGPHDTKK
jgi:hypothetical protein